MTSPREDLPPLLNGSAEPEINKHQKQKRSPLMFKVLFACVVLILLGVVGFKLYSLYKSVATQEPPQSHAPESGTFSSKHRDDLGQTTRFFDEGSPSVPGANGPEATGTTAPIAVPVAVTFQKYRSIPTQASNRSESPSGTSQDEKEAVPGKPLTPAAKDAQAATGMKVEAITMDPNLYIEANTYIPCSLQTRFVSDVAGRITCTVSEDVYSANSHTKLIEKGTKAFGNYRTGTLKQGQSRMFVVWTELRTEDFKKISLVDTQVVGQLGEAGIDGWVDEHFWDRFKGALMLSVVQDGFAALANNSVQKDQQTDYTANSRENMAAMSNTALENSINIAPTIYKNQGDVIGILVGEDIDFSGVYSLRLKQ